MNFNIDFLRPFELIKKTDGAFLRAGLIFALLCTLFTVFSVTTSIYLFSMPSLILAIALIILFAIGAITYNGYFLKVTQNMILENENCMPNFKGNFKKYFAEGLYVSLMGIIFCSVCYVFLVFLNLLFPFFNNPFNVFLAFLAISFLGSLFIAYYAAYAHSLSINQTFSNKTNTIYRYGLIEFLYAISASILINPILSLILIVFTAIFMALLAVIGVLFAIIHLKIVSLLLLITGCFFIAIMAFLAMFFAIFYTLSMVAQSYNYGKYFFGMGEAPKRTRLEILTPILFIVLACAILAFTKSPDIYSAQDFLNSNLNTVQEFLFPL